MTNAQIKQLIKNKLSEQVESSTKVRIVGLKYDAYILPCGKVCVKSATGIAKFWDYRFGDNGIERFEDQVQVSI